MRKRAYLLGREMIWSHVAQLYMESFQRARRSRLDVPVKPLAVRTLAERPLELPGWRLDHLLRMTDSTGIFQHASFAIPNFAEGYCTDDNARALLLTVLLEELGQDSPEVQQAGDDLRRLPERRLRPGEAAVPQLPGLRPPLARRGRLRRLPRPGACGRWGPASAGRSGRDLPVLGRADLRPGPADLHELTSPRAWAFDADRDRTSTSGGSAATGWSTRCATR